MTATAAQDEFNELFRDKSRRDRHPEDDLDSDIRSDSEKAEARRTTTKEDRRRTYYIEDSSDDDDNDPKASHIAVGDMRSRYYIPRQRHEANTGPKGVIADAQAFEQAKKAQKLSSQPYKSSNPVTASPPAHHPRGRQSYIGSHEKAENGDDDESFLSRWRQSRLRELQKHGRRLTSRSRSRGASPARRIFGTLRTVDGDGYLDAIEKVDPQTVVVVFIYDDMSSISDAVEECVRKLARVYSTTRFVKLHYEDAEMEVAGVPALLAYRGGDKFAGLVPVLDEIPDDQELSPITLEAALKKHYVL